MKKIIKGKLYDTDTAELIDIYEFSNMSDFHWYREKLYRKANGEFFLYGRGAALSPYREYIDCNNWTGGESIIPLSEYEAKVWIMDHSDAEIYIKLFGVEE